MVRLKSSSASPYTINTRSKTDGKSSLYFDGAGIQDVSKCKHNKPHQRDEFLLGEINSSCSNEDQLSAKFISLGLNLENSVTVPKIDTVLTNNDPGIQHCLDLRERLSFDPIVNDIFKPRIEQFSQNCSNVSDHFFEDAWLREGHRSKASGVLNNISQQSSELNPMGTIHKNGLDGRAARSGSSINKSFSDVAKNSLQQRFIAILLEESEEISADGVMIPDQEEVRQNIKKLEFALVGKILGKKLSYTFICYELRKRWNRFGEFKFMLIGGVSFIFIFSSIGARDAVLNGGLWNIAGHLIGLSKWSPSFDPNFMEGLFTPVWVRFPNLPLLYLDKKNIAPISSMIGRPLWFDEVTNIWGKGSYARACICLDISKQLPKGTWIQGIRGKFFQPCEYEEVPIFYFNCGKIGHKREDCPDLKITATMTVGGNDKDQQMDDASGVTSSMAVNQENIYEGGNFDSNNHWVVVKRKPKPVAKKVAADPGVSPAKKGTVLKTDVSKRWRLKGSIFSVGESSGKQVSFPVQELSRSVVSHQNCGIVFRDPLIVEQPLVNQITSSLKGKEVLMNGSEDVFDHINHLMESQVVGVETKVNGFDRKNVDRLFGKQWEFHCHASNGLAGGIIVFWNTSKVSFKVLGEMDQCILGSLEDVSGNYFMIATIYACTNYVGRRALWFFLQQHCLNLKLPLVVGGDFNCVLNQEDKKGGKPFAFNSSVQELLNCMVTCDLKETRFSGPRFTWTNNKVGAGKIWVRHDRFLVNSFAMQLLPLVLTYHLVRVASDHAPILLYLLDHAPLAKPLIRLEDTWVSYHQSWRIIKAKWFTEVQGTAAEILNKKCRKSLRALFFWSKNELKELNDTKLQLEKSFLQLQQAECSVQGLNQIQMQEMKYIAIRKITEGLIMLAGRRFVFLKSRVAWGSTLSGKFTVVPWTWLPRDLVDLSKILQEGWRSLKGAIRWKRSNGAKVSILNDVWILDKRLSVWPSFYNVSLDVSDKVDVLLEDGCWKEDVLLELFGPSLAELIREGIFTNSDERFDWLQTVKLLPREHMLWWRSLHDAIPTQAWLVQKGLEVSENYIWGCLVKEDLHHIMYQCKFSLDVYDALEGWGFPLPCLIKRNSMERNRGLVFSQADSLFLKSVYQIWINRNNKKHGKNWVSPSLVAAYVLGNFNLVNLFILWKQWDTTRLYPIGLSWYPPPSKWLKVNVDGALQNPYKAGLGVVVRDSTGKLIVAAGKQLIHWDVAYIELLSIALLKEVLNEHIMGAMGLLSFKGYMSIIWQYRNGDTYAGEYFADKMHGFGVYRFANGHRYEGAWHEGRRQGLGMYIFRNGEAQAGYWQNGTLDVLITQNSLPGSPVAVNHSKVLNAVQEAQRAAERAFDLPRFDDRAHKTIAAANKAANAARVAAVKAVQKPSPSSGGEVLLPLI
ncbi:hypothetical protein M5K25_022306 [Dendrobium thyrsiflorum]|uniref:CCHC-type domain-containing protein n=1 Tax=Dendrobium thyrsiflorum TaxID=117978 RepID=A0ABD0U605_DENTH